MPDVAAFDFDGTLTEGGSVFGYLSALRGPEVVVPAALALGPRLIQAAVAGGAVADRTKELLFERVLAGVALERAEEVGTEFVLDHLDRHLRSGVRRRFDWHRGRGDRVVIVSASPEIYVRVAGVRLGADGVVATRLAVGGEGALTGHYDGANCRGEEKLRRLRQWIDESGGPEGRLWAYGNSRGDLRMLRAADVGVNVGRLGRVGQLRSFPGLDGTEPGRPPG
jgi:phosphatidylglycerophosphatase C